MKTPLLYPYRNARIARGLNPPVTAILAHWRTRINWQHFDESEKERQLCFRMLGALSVVGGLILAVIH